MPIQASGYNMVILCDGCGNKGEAGTWGGVNSDTAAIKQFRGRGWIMGKDKCFCIACAIGNTWKSSATFTKTLN